MGLEEGPEGEEGLREVTIVTSLRPSWTPGPPSTKIFQISIFV